MIAGWVAYCLVVSTLLATAAAAADSLLTRRGRSARWIWLAAIVGSLAVPSVAYVAQQRMPSPIRGAGEVNRFEIFDRVRRREALAAQGRPLSTYLLHVQVPEWLAADRIVTAAIIACILLATARVGVDSILLFRARRQWRPNVLDGEQVLQSSALGPAIVGLLEPTIVVPDWAAALPSDERALMLAHEREHLRARDSLLASAGLLGALCMPWSPAMWWSFRRLRTAIEVDCDRRVLRVFPDVSRYGRLLVDVAERSFDGSSLAITGFSERAGPLARRIHAMTQRADAPRAPRRRWDYTTAPLGIAAVASALLVLPPAPEARVLPGYSAPNTLLAKNVADSVSTNPDDEGKLGSPRILRPARDLPGAFIVEADNAEAGVPRAGHCAEWLRDPHTGTRLHRKFGQTRTESVVQRGDTAWTRVVSTGFYLVDPVGAYGVGDHQLLRVGCGAVNHRSIAGQVDPSSALSDLDSRSDDRARRIGRAVAAAIHRSPNAVELYRGRLNVVTTDSSRTPSRSDDMWEATRAVWTAARDVLGRSAMPETLAFSVRYREGSAWTLYYFSSHPHKPLPKK